MEEKDLKAAQKGDKEAFTRLYDEYADRLFKFVLIKVGNKPQAEDILQDVFIKAWQALPKFKTEGGNLNAWLYRIATNSITDYYRKLYRKPEALELNEEINIAAPQSISEEIETQADIATLKNALAQLRPSYRQVLELRFIQDFTISETAKILNKSNLAVRLLQHRALKDLKIILQNEDLGYSKI